MQTISGISGIWTKTSPECQMQGTPYEQVLKKAQISLQQLHSTLKYKLASTVIALIAHVGKQSEAFYF